MSPSSQKWIRLIVKGVLLIPLLGLLGASLNGFKQGNHLLGVVVLICSGLAVGIINYKPKQKEVSKDDTP
jgi:hypothetical protein